MVGYHPDESLTQRHKLFAGCVSGVITRFVTQPLDVLKVRAQLQRKSSTGKSMNILSMSKKMLLEEGITAFWHGHNIGQIHSILSTASQFYVYEMTTKLIFSYSINPNYKAYLEFMCGISAGCCCATLVSPLEVIRVRQMLVKEQYRGLINGALAVYRAGGILAFYEGWTASVLMVLLIARVLVLLLGPQVGITFSIFSLVQPVILNYFYECDSNCTHAKVSAHKAEHLVLASSLAGGVSGFVSKVATYPLDLAKRRLQIASHKTEDKFRTPSTSKNLIKCTRLIQCIVDTFKAEGFFGLYRGLPVTVYKSQATNVVMFTTYELICFLLRK